MNESWNLTQKRLRKWQRESSTGWELRRILSDSEFFKVIAMCAHKRAKNAPKNLTWQDWWAFHFERIAEREAMQLLLDVWNKDVWAHIHHQARSNAQQMLTDIAEQARLAQEFAVALDRIISTETQDIELSSDPDRSKPPRSDRLDL